MPKTSVKRPSRKVSGTSKDGSGWRTLSKRDWRKRFRLPMRWRSPNPHRRRVTKIVTRRDQRFGSHSVPAVGVTATGTALARLPQGASPGLQQDQAADERILGLQTSRIIGRFSRLISAEWRALDECCLITILLFFRDIHVFEVLRRYVLPDIAVRAKRERRDARIWSAGCASGEEVYTLRALWDLEVTNTCPDVSVSVTAADIDTTMLARAREACFQLTSLRQFAAIPCRASLPSGRGSILRETVASRRNRVSCIRTYERTRQFVPLISSFAATSRSRYFSTPVQKQVLARVFDRLLPRCYLAIGTHEKLPDDGPMLRHPTDAPQIVQKAHTSDGRDASGRSTKCGGGW